MNAGKIMKNIIRTLFKIVYICYKIVLKVSLLLLGQEIMVRKMKEDHLRIIAKQEAQARMNDFINIISHDIKTPLTSIKGNIQLMGWRLKDHSNTDALAIDEARQLLKESREVLERTDKQVNRLTQLVNNLIESSRIYSNSMDMLFEVCELNGMVREVTQDARYISEARSMSIEIPEEKTLLVMADVNRIKQVLIQYLANAHRYSALESPIEVSLREDGKSARVQVRDKGPGIAAHEHKRIWERYYRVPNCKILNGSEVGLGLGLHICSQVIEQHNGKYGVMSALGHGSTFWFTLPLVNKN